MTNEQAIELRSTYTAMLIQKKKSIAFEMSVTNRTMAWSVLKFQKNKTQGVFECDLIESVEENSKDLNAQNYNQSE